MTLKDTLILLLALLTGLQLLVGLIALYVWAFGLAEFPKNAGVALMFGPFITFIAATFLWGTR